jgi:hypothetical protein
MSTPETYPDKNGYLRYRDSDYLVHRRAMEKKLGRRLEKGEIVHHVNGNKLDNRPENLELLTPKEHYKRHVVPLLEERREARIVESLTPRIEAQAAKAIVIAFAALGAILLIVGLISGTRLAMWYLGLVFSLGALAGWLILRRGE